MWRRFIPTTLIVVAVLAPAVSATANVNTRASGTVVGQVSIGFGPPCTSADIGIERFATAVRIPGERDAILAVDPCFDYSFVVTRGTFTLATARGMLFGVVSGHEVGGGSVWPVDLTLVVTHGTKVFKRVAGSLQLTGLWTPSLATDQFQGVLTTSLTHRHPRRA